MNVREFLVGKANTVANKKPRERNPMLDFQRSRLDRVEFCFG